MAGGAAAATVGTRTRAAKSASAKRRVLERPFEGRNWRCRRFIGVGSARHRSRVGQIVLLPHWIRRFKKQGHGRAPLPRRSVGAPEYCDARHSEQAGAAGSSVLPGVKRARQRDRNPRDALAISVELATASGSWRRLCPRGPSYSWSSVLAHARSPPRLHADAGCAGSPPGHRMLGGSRRLAYPGTARAPAPRRGQTSCCCTPSRFRSSTRRLHTCNAHPRCA
jgi:hypothetical protein